MAKPTKRIPLTFLAHSCSLQTVLCPPKRKLQSQYLHYRYGRFRRPVHVEEKADGTKDFSAVIERAIELAATRSLKNSLVSTVVTEVTTGFGHGTVLNC